MQEGEREYESTGEGGGSVERYQANTVQFLKGVRDQTSEALVPTNPTVTAST